MSTIAKACSDEPKISASEREASTSSPMETPPVRATSAPAHRIVAGEAEIGSGAGVAEVDST